jgi:predicted DNA-binding transcriptional regulator AlpA
LTVVNTIMTHHLVGVAEIAELLGISRQRVNAIVKTHEDFPRPEVELAAGRIWKREDVERWARKTGRIKRK